MPFIPGRTAPPHGAHPEMKQFPTLALPGGAPVTALDPSWSIVGITATDTSWFYLRNRVLSPSLEPDRGNLLKITEQIHSFTRWAAA